MHKSLITILLILTTALTFDLKSQSTWDNVYTILNTNCSSSSCHGSGGFIFNVDAAPSVLYAQLVNVNPLNFYAKDSANNKLVAPGSPQTSFLMRKLSHCLSGPLSLTLPFEGAKMPDDNTRLADADLELIYTWIFVGAPETGIVSPNSIIGDVCNISSLITTAVTGSSLCKGDSIAVSYSVFVAFNNGNTFTAQLSDDNGSFANPVNIGQISGTTAGTINAIIPAGTASGSGYRIRVISSDPPLTASDNGNDLIVNPLPAAPTITGPSTVNLLDLVSFSADSLAGYDYNWTLNGGNITGGNSYGNILQASFYYSGTDSVSLQWTDANGCRNSSSIAVVALCNSVPVPVIAGPVTSAENTTLTYSTEANTDRVFNWWVTGGAISAGQGTASVSVFWGGAGTGSVSVQWRDENRCMSDTTTIQVAIGPLGISGPAAILSHLTVYPNPAQNKLFIHVKNSTGIIISDVLGAKALQHEVPASDPWLDISSLTPGLYFVYDREHQAVAKFVKE